MKALSAGVLMLLCALPALACGSDDDQGAGGTNCERYCGVAMTLNCTNHDEQACVPMCDQRYQAALQAKPACKAALDLAAACLADSRSADFQCNASGQAQTKAQFCAIEIGKADTCLRS